MKAIFLIIITLIFLATVYLFVNEVKELANEVSKQLKRKNHGNNNFN